MQYVYYDMGTDYRGCDHIFAVLSIVPCVRKVNFLSRLSCHVLGDPTMAPLCRCPPLCFLQTPVISL